MILRFFTLLFIYFNSFTYVIKLVYPFWIIYTTPEMQSGHQRSGSRRTSRGSWRYFIHLIKCTPFYNIHMAYFFNVFLTVVTSPFEEKCKNRACKLSNAYSSFSESLITPMEPRNHYSPIDSIGLHPGEPVLTDLQHELKASCHALDILRTL